MKATLRFIIRTLFRTQTLVFFLVLAILTIHTFSLREIKVDRYTIILLGLLLFLATLPSVRLIKIPYVFEFHKALKKKINKQK